MDETILSNQTEGFTILGKFILSFSIFNHPFAFFMFSEKIWRKEENFSSVQTLISSSDPYEELQADGTTKIIKSRLIISNGTIEYHDPLIKCSYDNLTEISIVLDTIGL